MKKYYRIFRIDMHSVKIRDDRRDEYSTYHTSESCLVKDGCDTYESEEEAEKRKQYLRDYTLNIELM